MQELPEITAVSKKDTKYHLHLRHSINYIDDALSRMEKQMELLEESSPHHVPCNPILSGVAHSIASPIARLEGAIEKAAERRQEFIDAALEAVTVEAVYDSGVPARRTHFFFDNRNGNLKYAMVDFCLGAISSNDDYTAAGTLAELKGSESLEGMIGAAEDQNIYFVSVPSDKVPMDKVRKMVARRIHSMMEKRYPNFMDVIRPENNDELPVLVSIITEDGEELIVGLESVREERQYPDEILARFDAIAGEITEDDPRMN